MTILRRSPRPLLKTHADPNLPHLRSDYAELREWIDQTAQKIYVLRDGRSVLCSLHLFMQSFAPETRCSLSDFLRQTVNGKSRVRMWAEHVYDWIDRPDVSIVKFENLVQSPRQTVLQLGEMLGLPPTYTEPLLPQSPKTIWQGRWNRLTQWQPDSSAIIGYYGGQKTKKWVTALDKSDRAFFHQEAGELLIKLDYVDSDAWVHHV